MSAEAKLHELGITLPNPPAPVAAYVPWVRSGNLVYVSGQIPMADGKMQFAGKVGADLSAEEGSQAARLCALNVLAQLRAAAGSLDKVTRVIKLNIFVASAPGFTAQPQVGNGASELMVEVFGDKGRHARAAVGAPELPLNAAVEVDAVVEVAD